LEVSDLELLRRARGGDEKAFGALVDRHAAHLYGLACLLVGNSADAEDVLQETLTGAVTGMWRFGERASVKTWLVRILMRQASKFRRGRSRRPAVSLDAGAGEAPYEGGPAVRSSADAVDARLDISQMLSELSPEHAQVIVLREIEGFSYEEMAEALGVPRGTVESRLHRAREELRKRFRGTL